MHDSTKAISYIGLGKIISVSNPCFTIPCLPAMVAGVEIDNEEYVLSIDSHYVMDKLIINNIEYYNGDIVHLTGNIYTKQDLIPNEYLEFELLSITKNNTATVLLDTSPNLSVFVHYNQGIINIHIETLQTSYRFEIFDIMGKLLLVQSLNMEDNTINLKTFNKGIYIYRLSKDGKIICQGKIVQER
jgi:hypothetical protein